MKLFVDDAHDWTQALGQKHPQGAVFSRCRNYRYLLYREWEPLGPTCDEMTAAFIGLNPSTATASTDDPTIRRCVDFAKRLGYNKLLMLNLIPFITSDPAELKRRPENRAAAERNRAYLRYYTGGIGSFAADTICAWGAGVDKLRGEPCLLANWQAIERPAYCLGKTKSGQPRHPLYLAKTAQMVAFNECEFTA